VLSNRAYRVLEVELLRAATPPGPASKALLSLDTPPIDWVKLSESQGVSATRCTTGEELDAALERAMATRGPALIEAVL
jgi:acetolactate synthase I/II/III large subunit